MDWNEFKKSAIKFIVETFEPKQGEYLEGLWTIAVPIIENISKIDMNDDNVVVHYKQEIWNIANDEGVQFGNDLTEALIASADGGFLKQLLASAWISKAIAAVIPGTFPGETWLVNLVIEWIVGGIKKGLESADEKLDDYADGKKKEYGDLLHDLVIILEEKTGFHITSAYFWGSDTFTLYVTATVDSTEEPQVFPGSMSALKSYKDNDDYEAYVELFRERITGEVSPV
ncbi:MAG: hypothetical protein ACTSRU_20790 [Candidatus Hodarchaeales archaeon]